MTSTYSTNKAIEEPANGDYVNTWSTPVNSNFNIIDKAFGGHLIINATGASGTTALTTTQYQNLYILFSGTLSANVNYQVPSGVGGQWVVYNGTSGAFTLTLSSGGGGSSVTITQGTRTLIVSDGTNVTLSVNTVTSPGGADTSIQFNQSGVFGGSSNLAWNYGTNTLGVTGAANISGNVGIGTSSPTTKLTVSGSGFNGGSGTFISTTNGNSVAVNGINATGVNDSAYIYLSDGTNTAYAGLTAQNASGTVGSLRFGVAGTEYARIQPNGNVGIGTTTPSIKLSVVANTNGTDGLSVSNTSTGAYAQAWLNVVAQGWTGVQLIQNQASGTALFYTDDNIPMIFVNNSTERMRITAAGNVGIGTSNPDSFYGNAVPLAVVKNQNAATIFGIANSTVGTSAVTQINIIGGTSQSYVNMGLADNNGSPYFTNDYGLGVNYAKWGFGGTERMRITAAGNVGVGTSTPGYLLHVAGNGYFNTAVGINQDPTSWYSFSPLLVAAKAQNAETVIGIGNTTVGTAASTTLKMIGGTAGSYVDMRLADNNGSPCFTDDYGSGVSYAKWGFGGTERMRITAAGNVGIGTSAPSYLLDVNGTGRFTGALTLSTALSAANGGTGLTSAGTSGNVLTSNGSAWVSSAPTQPQIQTQILTVGSGTWTAPAGVTKVFVAVVGGGGGGNATYYGGTGGIAIGEYTVVPGTGYSYTVGTGGTGVNSGNASSGSASSFSTLLSATGGGGGNNSTGTGADGTGSSGTLRNASAMWAAQSTPLGGLQATGAGSNAASSWGINSATMAGGPGYPNGGVGLGGNSGGIYLMWVG